jgi:MFS family permease
MTGQFLIGGALNAVALALVALLISRLAGEIYGRALLAIVLFIAGGVYLGFAVGGGASGWWALAELVQGLILGVLGLLGLRGSPYWLAAGWALHPLWDVVLHHLGPGHEFAPEPWVIACVSFDLIIAAYLVVTHRFGLTRGMSQQRVNGVNQTDTRAATHA